MDRMQPRLDELHTDLAAGGLSARSVASIWWERFYGLFAL
jgi:hypothetical protein